MSAVLDTIAALGLSDDPLSASLVENTPGYPFPTDPTILEPAVVDRQVEHGRLAMVRGIARHATGNGCPDLPRRR